MSIQSTCINSKTVRGMNLMYRIAKMKQRGWACINETCYNPLCVAAIPGLLRAYEAFQRAERSRKELEFYHERQRQRKLRIELYQRIFFGRITGKIANTINFEKSEKSRAIDLEKFVKRQKKTTNQINGNPLYSSSKKKIPQERCKKNKSKFYLLSSIKEELDLA